MRPLAAVTGILGGLCLLVEGIAETGLLGWIGLGLLAVAVLCIGLTLVPKAPVWLQAIVAVGVVGLAASVLATLHSAADASTVDSVVGAAAVLFFLFMAVRWRRSRPRPARHHGTHAR